MHEHLTRKASDSIKSRPKRFQLADALEAERLNSIGGGWKAHYQQAELRHAVNGSSCLRCAIFPLRALFFYNSELGC